MIFRRRKRLADASGQLVIILAMLCTPVLCGHGATAGGDAAGIYFRVCGPACATASYALDTARPGEGALGEYSLDGITWFALPVDGACQYTNSIGVHDPGFFIGADGTFYVPHTLQSADLVSPAPNFGLFATRDFIQYARVGTGVIPFNNRGTNAISWAPDIIESDGKILLYGTMSTAGWVGFDGAICALVASNASLTSWTAPTNAFTLITNESPVTNGSRYGVGNGVNDSFGFNVVTNTYLTNNAGQSVLLSGGTYLHIAYNWNTINYDAYTNTQAGMPHQLHLAMTNVTSFPNGSEAGMFVRLPNGHYRFYGSVGVGDYKGRFFYCDNVNGMIGGWGEQHFCVEVPRATFGQSTVTILRGENAAKLRAAIAAMRKKSLEASYLGTVAIFSVRRIPSKFSNGPIMDVRRSRDDQVAAISATSQGDLDTYALLRFVGRGTGYVTRWYDQSGNGNDAVQPERTNQPTIVTRGELNVDNHGSPTIRWGSTTSLKSVREAAVFGGFSTAGWYGRNWSKPDYAVVISSADYLVDPGGTGWVFQDSAGSTVSAWTARAMLVMSSGTGRFSGNPPYGGEIAGPTIAFLSATNDGVFYEIETVAGTTNTGVWINGSTNVIGGQITCNGPTMSSVTNFFIGRGPNGEEQDGGIGELWLWNYALMPDQRAAVRGLIAGYYEGAAANRTRRRK